MAIDAGIGDRELLSSEAKDAFALIVAGEDPSDEMPEAVAELVALGVVVRDLRGGNRPVALDPSEVISRHLETELRKAEDSLTRMRALPKAADVLSDAFERSRLHAGGRSEYIPSPTVVNARLEDVVNSAQLEILAAQPSGPRTQHHLEGARGRDTGALDRGVAMRTLYRATVRDNTVTAQYAHAMANRAAGRSAEFRTLEEPFERAIIIDRRVAFISNTLVAGGDPNAAWQITDGAFVAYIVAEFEARWRRADPWRGEVRARGQQVDTVSAANGVRTTRRQREVMREMIDGRDQRATASRLGVSVRTVSKEIDELKDLFDAESREQLAFKWAFSQDRLIDDSAPGDGLTVSEPAA